MTRTGISQLVTPVVAGMVFMLIGCGGSLSDEQRKKLREGIEDHKIAKVADAEIVASAMDEGRAVFAALEQARFDQERARDIARQYHARIHYITPGADHALEVEDQVIQAYIIGAETGATQDNIQKLRTDNADSQAYDSLLYSRPVISPMPDGVINVEGVWNIYLSKREIVRKLTRK